ncbi:DUF222 domain-containing protein [Jiangella asiatica]|uniref:DUF222 domain-containing protein n=1 Tax=Jiangella asiatica TaxID=2530372 RepID=A0A4R5D8G6_9ACTN|nr:DUF222 domain-containing protein [Jiangella asiatica]TDE09852.1 DUF222 domain-containing protein [Jiangella asiatica]
MFEKEGLAAGLSAGLLVGRDPRTGVWVSYEPWELPDDLPAAHGLVPDGFLGAELTALLDAGLRDDPAADGSFEAVAPGPELAVRLAAVDLSVTCTYDVVEAAAGWARLISWAQAGQARVLAELSTRPQLRPGRCGYRSVNPVTITAVEVAARTVTTTRQAENLVGHAVQLVTDFPATHLALAAGVIDERRAKVITGELGGRTGRSAGGSRPRCCRWRRAWIR